MPEPFPKTRIVYVSPMNLIRAESGNNDEIANAAINGIYDVITRTSVCPGVGMDEKRGASLLIRNAPDKNVIIKLTK